MWKRYIWWSPTGKQLQYTLTVNFSVTLTHIHIQYGYQFTDIHTLSIFYSVIYTPILITHHSTLSVLTHPYRYRFHTSSTLLPPIIQHQYTIEQLWIARLQYYIITIRYRTTVLQYSTLLHSTPHTHINTSSYKIHILHSSNIHNITSTSLYHYIYRS